MYQMSVVADDIDMRITHVIRGADHISNTPKQVLLIPRAGSGAADFRARAADSGSGQVAAIEAAWGDGREHVPAGGIFAGGVPEFSGAAGLVARAGTRSFCGRRDLLEKFSLEGVSRTNGVFDRAKLEWFNTQYLQKLPIEDLLPEVEAQLKQDRIVEGRVGGGRGARVVFEDRGFAAAADPVAAGFFQLVAGVFQRRVSD